MAPSTCFLVVFLICSRQGNQREISQTPQLGVLQLVNPRLISRGQQFNVTASDSIYVSVKREREARMCRWTGFICSLQHCGPMSSVQRQNKAANIWTLISWDCGQHRNCICVCVHIQQLQLMMFFFFFFLSAASL